MSKLKLLVVKKLLSVEESRRCFLGLSINVITVAENLRCKVVCLFIITIANHMTRTCYQEPTDMAKHKCISVSLKNHVS